MDVRKFRGAGVLLLCLLLTAAGIWNFRQTSQNVAVRTVGNTGPVNAVDTEESKIGLLFQVTGSGAQTEEVLKILREKGKKATFFVTEAWGEQWPELVTEIVQEGHELGILSQEGKRSDLLTRKEAAGMLEQAGERLMGLTGKKIQLFQERGNRYGEGLLNAVQMAGAIPVGGSVDVEDWKDYDSDVIFQMVAGNEKLCPGALLLFHTGAKNMAPALEKLIPKLGAMGYDMVPVGGLFHFSL